MEIEKILSNLHGKMTEAEFTKLVEEKIKEFGGLLSRDGATLIVASELGIPIDAEISHSLDASELVEGATSVNFVGIVSEIFPVREFLRNNNVGKVASLLLSDKTGSIRTVFWNDDTDKIKDVKKGDVIEIIGGYIKKGLYGQELNMGRRGRLHINPSIEKELPPLQKKTKKISELGLEVSVDVVGVVLRIFGIREFKKEEITGRVSSFIMRDDTGEIRVSLWGDKADLVESLKQGDAVRIEGCYTKQGMMGLELHLGQRGNLSFSEEKIPVSLEETSSYGTSGGLTFSCTVLEKHDLRRFERQDGSSGSVGSLIVEKGPEEKRLVLWNERCDALPFILVGMTIDVQDAYSHEGINGEEIHIGASGRIIPRCIMPDRKIGNLKHGSCEIKGRISSEKPLILTDESGGMEIVFEGKLKRGEAVCVTGECENDKIIVRHLEKIKGDFPEIEELQNPTKKSIRECTGGDIAIVCGLVRRKLKTEDCFRYIIDDGEEEISGVAFKDLDLGKEYAFKVSIKQGNMKEFVAHEIFEISESEVCKALIERIEELVEV